MLQRERRQVTFDKLELRSGENGVRTLSGHAAVFNRDSEEMYGFTERVAPGAFKQSVGEDDIRALFNHDPNYVLGRNSAKTLRVSEDGAGLAFDVDLPDTQVARDLAVLIERGDITGCSFSFCTRKDEWQYDKTNDKTLRTLLDVQLFDVGPVTFPAYPDTDVAVRSAFEAKVKEVRGESVAATPVAAPGLAVRQLRRRLELQEVETTFSQGVDG